MASVASFATACSTRFKAVHNSGPRRASDIRYVVIHDTEGDTAAGAASWFENPASGGSANLCVDAKECYRTVDDLVVPWAAPPLNQSGFHIEIAGHRSWTREQWLADKDGLRRGAWKGAQRAIKYSIPVRRVGWLGLKLRRKGFTDHASVSRAFKQSDHTDPGAGFPWDVFMALVKRYVAQQTL